MPKITSGKGLGKLSGKAFMQEKGIWEEFVKWRNKQKTIIYPEVFKNSQEKRRKNQKLELERNILKLYSSHLEYEEIAKSLGISVNKVLQTIHLNK